MHQYGRTFDMPQEVKAQALALAGAGNQPRHFRNGECFVPHIDDAQVRLQRGKRVVADLWFRRRQHRNERRLPGRWETDQAHIRHGFQLQHHVVLLPRLTPKRKPRRLAHAGRQRRIAQATEAAARRDEPHTHSGEIGQLLPRFAEHHGSHRHRQHQVRTPRPVAVIAGSVRPAFRLQVRPIVQVKQGMHLRRHL